MNSKHPNDDIVLGVGERVIDFSLPDTDGTVISLSAVLAQGPAIIIFYRGDW